jgi:HEAT repeat protein
LVKLLLTSDHTSSQSQAAEALGNMGESGKTAIPYLTTAAKHVNANVREKATQALAKLR